ncbi:MAG: tRNA (adenosine(37)-N6)-threonylcarbamoyltransferase complex transferase subunit TsaD [Ignavibacteriales bacterium CG_4_9_14_3_um_filter_30_11]|nr:MAG: tRNA (adenosine(37)-N6)-threonylcarbamoyltransferase complex transferase subunit TsaD [Ignavibacteriales bacterium CG_4_9_14_3_um_filter_30_11]
MNVLGIESSCDETSIAILSNNKILSNLISSQDFHKEYGGVVPELSSRAHLQIISPLVKKALKESKLKLQDIDLICATAGPGLIGALLVGFTFAKGLSLSLEKPFIPVNHIEGHIFSGFLMEEKPDFPYLALVVSGGHTLLLLVNSFTEIIKLGSTIDDAAGEAFDKVAKMLSLDYPGGANIQVLASKTKWTDITFPIAVLKGEYDFSFSGVKTSVLRFIQKKSVDENLKNNIAFAFQNAITSALIKNTEKALKEYEVNSISLVGGVAANINLRKAVINLGEKYKLKSIIPKLEYCGDNAAMIAYRGMTLFNEGKRYDLNSKPFPYLKKDEFKS